MKAQDPSGQSAYFASQLGGFQIPRTALSEVAADMDRLLASEARDQNPRQLSGWRNKWKRAAKNFTDACEDKAIKEITVNDAYKLRRHWAKRVQVENIETIYANKHLGYVERMIEAFYEDLELDEMPNPFTGIRIKDKQAGEIRKKPNRKREFKPAWIKEKILSPDPTESLNEEARDILRVCAETGCRASEVFDVPAKSIILNAEIPHLRLKIEESTSDEPNDGRRVLKTASAIRDVPIVGAALEAMKRHPQGFPRYRGKASFYATANEFFRDNELFPTSKHTLGGLRHSYESRMRRLKISNEERAQLMGHSLHSIRGREVYGDETDLRIRALYAEMIAFPTERWSPRPYSVLSNLIDAILDEEGFKRPD